MQSSNGDAFWAFSLRFYALPGVSEACLALQEEAAADVNVLLFILWRAHFGVALASDDVKRLDAHVCAWRADVVQPLRSVRRKLKISHTPVGQSPAHELRQKIKALELESERLQQFAMADYADQAAGRVGVAPDAAARDGFAAYGNFLGVVLPAQHVATLLDQFHVAATKAN